MHQLLVLVVVAVVVVVPLLPVSSLDSGGFRLDVKHVDAGTCFGKQELLRRMLVRSRAKKSKRRSLATATVSWYGTNEYYVELAIGTPPQRTSLILDTGSDLVWTQCLPCDDCYDQNLPYFNPSISSTYADIPCAGPACRAAITAHTYACDPKQNCVYFYSYADKSITVGNLATETITFFPPANSTGGRVVSAAQISFGCSWFANGVYEPRGTGIAGFGRGPLSLISQLGTDKFSYCFTSFDLVNSTSPLFVGPEAAKFFSSGSGLGGPVQTTSLIPNPAHPSFYYLPMTGITVGTTLLPIPESTFTINKDDGSGGVFIDSGTQFTAITEAAFEQVVSAFKSQLNSSAVTIPEDGIAAGFPCFRLPLPLEKTAVPRFAFHFDGADMDLPQDSYIRSDITEEENSACLPMTSSPDRSTVIGNFQQQGFHILYDLDQNKLSHRHTQCDQI